MRLPRLWARIRMLNKDVLILAMKRNWIPIAVGVWALWVSFTIQGIKDDVDDIYGDVRSISDEVSGLSQQSTELEEIQSELEVIRRRLPY